MATEIVEIQLTLKGGRITAASLDNATNKVRGLKRQLTLTDRVGKRLHSTMSTISKALISGFAISAVFGSIYLAINTVRKGFELVKDQIVEGVMAVADFTEQTLTLQGIIATTVKYSDDLEQNFFKAGQVARKVQIEFLKRTGEIIGTSQDAALVFQTLLGQGVAGLVDNMQEAVDLSILFTNAIIAVTPGQDKQRQLASETAAFLRGQVRATDRLAKLLGYSAKDLTTIRDNAKSSKDFFQQIQPRLEAIERASKEFGNTWTGIVTSMQDLIKILRLQVFTRLFDRVRSDFQKFRDQLLKDIDVVGQVLMPLGGVLGVIYDNMKNILMNWINNGPTLVEIVNNITSGFIRTYVWIKRIVKVLKLMKDIADLQNAAMTAFWDFDANRVVERTQAAWAELQESWKAVSNGPTIDHEVETLLYRVNKEVEKMSLEWKNATDNASSLNEQLTPMRNFMQELADQAKEFKGALQDINELIDKSKARALQNIAPDLFPFADIDADMARLSAQIAESFEKQGIKPGSDYWTQTEEALQRLTRQRYLERISEATAAVNKEAEKTALFFERAKAKVERFEIPEKVINQLREVNRLVVEGILGREAPKGLREFAAAAIRRAKFQAKTGALGLDIPGLDQGGSLQEAAAKIREQLSDGSKNFSDTAKLQLIGDLEGIDEMLWRVSSSFLDMRARGEHAFKSLVLNASSAKDVFASLKEGLGLVVAGMAEGLANMLVQVFSGSESLMSGLKKLLGSMLIQLGTFLVTAGTMAIAAAALGGFFPWMKPATGGPEGIPTAVAAIAVGTAAIAAGVALGGAGGGAGSRAGAGSGGGASGTPGMTTYLVDQQDVLVNQGINNGLDRLTSTLDSFEAAPAGSVWTKGAQENGGVMTVAAKEAKRGVSAASTQSLGGSVTGGRG